MCKKSKLRLGSYTLKFDFNGVGYTIVKIKGKGADLIIPKEFNDGKHGALNVTSIGCYAFSGRTGLTNITIPDSVTSIYWSAFKGCTGLTSITIPDSVTSIGGSAFYGCTRLTSITIPDSVTSIDSFTFDGCAGLTSITIPYSVTSIGEYAFAWCRGLTSITIPNRVTSIDKKAFIRCPVLTIYCEAKSKPKGWDNDWNFDNRPVVWGARMTTNSHEGIDDGIICK